MELNMRRYDLHSHTTASDGTLTPAELVKRAVNHHVDVLASTDHDSTAGLEEARDTILQCQLPLTLINGVEISTVWKNQSIHIVGLNIDPNHNHLKQLLQKQMEYRRERGQEIAAKLANLGIVDSYQKAEQYAQGDIVSRSHFARYLVDTGIVKDMNKAFKRYLGKGKPAYISPRWCSIAEAVEAIHIAGGVAVLAHPTRYDLTATKLKKLLEDFKQLGGDAIEVSQSRQSMDELYRLAKYALQYDFLASQGSDFHSIGQYVDLGKVEPLTENITPIWHNWSYCRYSIKIEGK
ncbi:MAG: PHP domain-containing protein [Candidatus Schmidhempelia sp.]|nr:PHP domain-containing protein [Candidatus Schmidhempelia sp.]